MAASIVPFCKLKYISPGAIVTGDPPKALIPSDANAL